MGRKKIEIKKITKTSSKQVTFSKRRKGLFNKASELSVLCDAEIAIIVFSPAGKVFSFSNHSVNSVINSFLNGSEPIRSNGYLDIVKRRYHNLVNELEIEKKREETIRKLKMMKQERTDDDVFWWEKSVNSVNELEEMKFLREGMKKMVEKRVDDLMRMNLDVTNIIGNSSRGLLSSPSSSILVENSSCKELVHVPQDLNLEDYYDVLGDLNFGFDQQYNTINEDES